MQINRHLFSVSQTKKKKNTIINLHFFFNFQLIQTSTGTINFKLYKSKRKKKTFIDGKQIKSNEPKKKTKAKIVNEVLVNCPYVLNCKL